MIVGRSPLGRDGIGRGYDPTTSTDVYVLETNAAQIIVESVSADTSFISTLNTEVGPVAFGRGGFGRNPVGRTSADDANPVVTLDALPADLVISGSASPAVAIQGSDSSQQVVQATSADVSVRLLPEAGAIVAQGSGLVADAIVDPGSASVIVEGGEADRVAFITDATASIVSDPAASTLGVRLPVEAAQLVVSGSATLAAGAGVVSSAIVVEPTSADASVRVLPTAAEVVEQSAASTLGVAATVAPASIIVQGSAAADLVATLTPAPASVVVSGTEFVSDVVAVAGDLHQYGSTFAFGRGGFGRRDITNDIYPTNTIIVAGSIVAPIFAITSIQQDMIVQPMSADSMIRMLPSAAAIVAQSRAIPRRPRVSVSVFD